MTEEGLIEESIPTDSIEVTQELKTLEEGLIEESILIDSVKITQELRTPEEVEQSISSAYDSVNLIKKLELLEEPTQSEVDCILRNRQHITIMLGMEWFVSALTPEQLEELSSYKAVE